MHTDVRTYGTARRYMPPCGGGGIISADRTDEQLAMYKAHPGSASHLTNADSCVYCCHVDGPIIECDSTMADVNQYNVYLRCLVRARPSVTSLFWIADVNGTTVSDDDVTSNYWSTVTVRCLFSFHAPLLMFSTEFSILQSVIRILPLC